MVRLSLSQTRWHSSVSAAAPREVAIVMRSAPIALVLRVTTEERLLVGTVVDPNGKRRTKMNESPVCTTAIYFCPSSQQRPTVKIRKKVSRYAMEIDCRTHSDGAI